MRFFRLDNACSASSGYNEHTLLSTPIKLAQMCQMTETTFHTSRFGSSRSMTYFPKSENHRILALEESQPRSDNFWISSKPERTRIYPETCFTFTTSNTHHMHSYRQCCQLGQKGSRTYSHAVLIVNPGRLRYVCLMFSWIRRQRSTTYNVIVRACACVCGRGIETHRCEKSRID